MFDHADLLRRCLKKRMSARAAKRLRRARMARGLRFEWLEQRTLLASDITIVEGALGSGSLDSFLGPTHGTILAGDGGASPGTVSTGALAGVGAAVNISITAQGSIAVNNLTSPLALQAGAGSSATFTASSGSLTFSDPSDGMTTAGGAINLSASTSMTLGGLNSGGGLIDITADDLDIQQAINAGTGVTTIRNSANGRAIDVGTNTVGKLGLTSAEINNITAAVLRIGSATAGAINVSAAINPIGTNVLALIS